LHIRTVEEIRTRKVSPVEIFEETLLKNTRKLLEQRELLEKGNLLKKGHYSGNVKVKLTDSSKLTSNSRNKGLYDLLVTSPPYGDNVTTVPYGQHSFLPLQWIDLELAPIG
jgi:hypothetical protein